MFRTQARSLQFKPEDGLSVIGLGRISVYEPRGLIRLSSNIWNPRVSAVFKLLLKN
jgi:exodeoxyribonuclease VII large subunit